MNETIKIWLANLYEEAIEDTKETIGNEHIWELGYNGEESNPHTENIEQLKEYIKVLEALKEELCGMMANMESLRAFFSKSSKLN